PGRAFSSATWTAGMPATFGASSIDSYKYSIYCNYTTTKSAEISPEITTIIEKFDLKVYPNPFMEKLRFEFVSPESVNARIDLYDMTGRLVKNIFEQPIEGGVKYNAEFKPEVIISGMYIYRVKMGEAIYTGKAMFTIE
ncbi:MAG: T9SS type A sorting domain-containing protein, partial [Draconibacterium sp.]|nr:T9SS type A sorting domain-containing protein [Draconibacterium sp.]